MVGTKNKKKNPDAHNKINQFKIHDSAYCEEVCKVEKCEMYKEYIYRVEKLFKIGTGLICDK